MTTVFEISMSLDGYVTAVGVRPEEPMGDGGQQLHEWAFGADQRGREVLAESVSKGGEHRRPAHLRPVRALVGSGRAGRRSPHTDVHRLPRHARARARGKRVHICEQSHRGARASSGRRR